MPILTRACKTCLAGACVYAACVDVCECTLRVSWSLVEHVCVWNVYDEPKCLHILCLYTTQAVSTFTLFMHTARRSFGFTVKPLSRILNTFSDLARAHDRWRGQARAQIRLYFNVYLNRDLGRNRLGLKSKKKSTVYSVYALCTRISSCAVSPVCILNWCIICTTVPRAPKPLPMAHRHREEGSGSRVTSRCQGVSGGLILTSVGE